MLNAIVSSTGRAISRAFREVLFLERARALASGRTADQQARIRELSDAVEARLAAAESLSASDQLPPALTLLSAATWLAIRGVLEIRGGPTEAPTVEAAWSELASLVASGAIGPAPAGFDAARAIATDRRPLAFDELSEPEGAARRADLESTLAWLRAQIEPRSLAQLKMVSYLRLGTVAIAAVGAIAILIAWGASKVLASKNVALGASVQLSSRRPDCPPGTGPSGAPPSGLVDGSKSGSYDVCTNFEVHPWATIELKKVDTLSKIVVYGRRDCCWGQYDLPIVLEVSENGSDYIEVDRRTTAYSASDPWVAAVGGKRAKFIRLRSDSSDQRELVLTEVEAFAGK